MILKVSSSCSIWLLKDVQLHPLPCLINGLGTASYKAVGLCVVVVVLAIPWLYALTTGGLREGEGSSSDGQEAVDYEVPEEIKTLHHLALQYVNQVLLTC